MHDWIRTVGEDTREKGDDNHCAHDVHTTDGLLVDTDGIPCTPLYTLRDNIYEREVYRPRWAKNYPPLKKCLGSRME